MPLGHRMTDEDYWARAQRRFWARVNKQENDCWVWVGPRFKNGYGRVTLLRSPTVLVHRIAYCWLVGPIPDGATVDHLCRNRACVNPAHMELVDHRENTLRGIGPSARNARKTHCDKGHAYAEHGRTRPNGARLCVLCAQEYQRDYYQRVTKVRASA